MERESTVDVENPCNGKRQRIELEPETEKFLCFILKGTRVKLLDRETKFIVHTVTIFRLFDMLYCSGQNTRRGAKFIENGEV